MTKNIARVIIGRMQDQAFSTCTAFHGLDLLSSGALLQVALDVRQAVAAGAAGPIVVFDDVTGKTIDLDFRGSEAEVEQRPAVEASGEHRGRGRPKLGVIAREVTLLPRQWDWLATHPGGASAVLRRLVDEARRKGDADLQRRAAQEAAYRFLTTIAGDQPGYEEAIRALFAGDRIAMEQRMDSWPASIRAYALELAFRHAT